MLQLPLLLLTCQSGPTRPLRTTLRSSGVTATVTARTFDKSKSPLRMAQADVGGFFPFIDDRRAWGVDFDGPRDPVRAPRLQLQSMEFQRGHRVVHIPPLALTDCFEPHLTPSPDDVQLYASKDGSKTCLKMAFADGGPGFSGLWRLYGKTLQRELYIDDKLVQVKTFALSNSLATVSTPLVPQRRHRHKDQ